MRVVKEDNDFMHLVYWWVDGRIAGIAIRMKTYGRHCHQRTPCYAPWYAWRRISQGLFETPVYRRENSSTARHRRKTTTTQAWLLGGNSVYSDALNKIGPLSVTRSRGSYHDLARWTSINEGSIPYQKSGLANPRLPSI